MSSVALQFDAGQAVAEAMRFSNALGIANQAIEKFIVTQAKSNVQAAAGDKFSANVRLITKSGEQVQMALKQVAGAWQTTAATVTDAQKKMEAGGKGGLGLGIDGATIAALIAYRQVIMSILGEIRSSAKESREYNVQISLLRTLTQDNQSTFNSWNQSIKDVSNSLGVGLMDTAKAAYEALSNQVTRGANDTTTFLMSIGEFARTTNSTVEESSNLFASVLNGFQQSLEHTDEIAAKLFKTIDLGRVKAADLANSLGRVTPLANQLGINLEEVLASISTLTRSGILPANALTFLLNLMQKLTQPTEDMKALLESWGTPTGEAAIATFGFVGVLEKLEKVTKGSASEVGRLFNELRGKQGFTGLTQNGFFEQFQRDVREISNPGGDYQNAIKIRAESSADVVNKQLNEIHNFFIGLGEDFTRFLAFFNNNFGTLVGTVRLLTNAVLAGVSAWGLYRLGVLGVNVASMLTGRTVVTMTGQIMTSNAALAAGTATAGRFSGVMAALGGPTGLITIAALGFAALVESFRKSKVEIDGVAESIQRLRDEQQKLKTEGPKNENLAEFNKVKSNVGGLFQNKLKETAKSIVEIQQRIQELQPIGEAINISLAGSFKIYIDSINRGISDYKTKINEAKRAIENSSKELLGFQNTLGDIVRETQLQYADVYQKQQLRENYIKQLRSEADNLYKSGRAEDSKTADQKLVEAAKLQKEIFDQQQQFRLQARREDIAAGFMPPEANRVVVETTELQQFYNELIQQQKMGHEAANRARRDEIKLTENLIDREEDRKKKIELISKELNSFNLTTKDNRIKPEFVDPSTGKLDPTKVEKFRKAQMDALRSLTKEGEGVEYFQNLDKQVDFIQRETEIRQQLNAVLEKQNKLRNEEKDIIRQFETNQSEMIKRRNELVGKEGSITDLSGRLGAAQDRIEDFAPSELSVDILKRGGASGQRAKDQIFRFEQVQNLRQQKKSIDELISQLQQKPVELITKQEIENLKERGEEYFSQYRLFIAQVRGVTIETAGQAVIQGGNTPADPKIALQDIENSYRRLINSAQESLTQLTIAKEKNKQIGTFGELAADLTNLNSISQQVAEGTIPSVQFSFDSLRGTIVELNAELEKTKQKILTIPKINSGFGGGGDNILEGGVEFKASGGVAGLHPGSPRGTDTIPAWLTRGEFIMPEPQTTRFRPVLEAMRRGQQPFYFSQGGVATTNVGDIHITVSGNQSTDAQIVDLGRKLQRKVRRGQINLS